VTPGILVAVVALVAGVGVVMFIMARKPHAEAGSAPNNDSAYALPESCRASGHAYVEYDTGWRCAGCGNHVPRQEGELYGLVSDGRHERRRESR
jgi:hypothetical protein